ncbi:MAG TPA: peptidoglycan DD-metalloendopeptidase family protein [Anaerolineales bacterium]
MSPKSGHIGSIVAWIVALSLVLFAAYLGWQMVPGKATVPVQNASAETIAFLEEPLDPMVSLPKYTHAKSSHALVRKVVPRTVIPSRPSFEVKSYTVELGDSVFEIASNFKIKPETLLWANYDQLNDNPDMVSIGMSLNIPPVDGVYYQWQDGDTVQSIATRFEAKIDDILNWSGNNLDLTEPTKSPGEWVMVPGGHREFRQWIIPVIPRGAAGVSKSVYGAGACEGGYEGAFGSGGFIWPAGNHSLSGNDYWSGHLGIDIAAGEGAPIYAADSGVVVFSGWATGGYGNMVMVDHGNGYQSVYAHLSNASASCGRSVGQGQIIGYSGSTGNSTGAHLHFEVRYLGGFVSPWYVLPAP